MYIYIYIYVYIYIYIYILISKSEIKKNISQKKYIYHTYQRIVRHDFNLDFFFEEMNLELSVKSFIVHPQSLCIKLL